MRITAGGRVGISATGLVSNVNFLYVNDPNPLRFHSFSTYSESVLNIANGDFCLDAPDFAGLGISGDVTLLTSFQVSEEKEGAAGRRETKAEPTACRLCCP